MKSEILGVRELQKVLRQLPDDLQKNALASVARAGARELQRVGYAHLAIALGSRTPREEDIIVKKRRGQRGDVQAIYDVGPPTNRPQLRWLHDGTKPHTLRARALTDGSQFFGREVQHPGQRARPWLKTATFASQDSVMRAMATQLRKALPKQVRKLVSSAYRDRQLRKFLR